LKKITNILHLLFFVVFLGNAQQDTLVIRALEVAEDIEINKHLSRADKSKDAANKLRHLLGAESVIDKEKYPLTLFEVYSQIGDVYQNEKLSEQALRYFNKANALPSPPVTKESQIELYEKLSDSHLQYGQPESALY